MRQERGAPGSVTAAVTDLPRVSMLTRSQEPRTCRVRGS